MPMVLVEEPTEHVRVIRLNDPDTLNSMSFGLVGDLYAALEQVRRDNACSVVVMIGEGRGFCSGLIWRRSGCRLARRGSRWCAWRCAPWRPCPIWYPRCAPCRSGERHRGRC